MSIDVYWANTCDQWMRAEKPESVIKRYASSKLFDGDTKILNCPSFMKELNNTFALKSIYSYEMKIENNGFVSNMYNQEFFDKHILIRSIEKKFFSFIMPFVFFTNEPSLEIECLPAFLEDSYVVNSTITVPGTYDIGKWYRPVEFPFYLKNNFNSFKINDGDVFSYIKFKTNKKINFIQYRISKKIVEYQTDILASRMYNDKHKKLDFYYEKFSIKKQILKEIKKNIVEKK